jgi:hypothetical protein
MDSPIVINQIHTACQYCVFADYTNNTQEGCVIGELNKFRNYGYEIIEAKTGEIENGQIIPGTEDEFFVINNTKCTKKRTNDWNFASSSLTEQLQAVGKECELKYTAVIFEDNNPYGVFCTAQSLLKQSIPPQKIIVIRPYNSGTSPLGYVGFFEKENISWKIQNFCEDYSEEEMTDMVVFHIKTSIYSIFHAGFIVPPNMFNELNYQVNEEFLNFILIIPNSTQNGQVGMTAAYMTFNGNLGQNFEEKIKESNPKCLYQISRIIKNFPE